MTDALVATANHAQQIAPRDQGFPAVPWRDPHTVSPAELAVYVRDLEAACAENPQSADLRTCLGMAYAVGYDVYKSMDALEAAVALDSTNFWAQLKYAELHFRLRVLIRAEEETLKAVNIARTPWQLAVARTQLRQIRKLLHESTRNVTWNKPLLAPTLVLCGMLAAVVLLMVWK